MRRALVVLLAFVPLACATNNGAAMQAASTHVARPKPPVSTLPHIDAGTPPPTAVHDVTNTYFGVKVVDPYRWLESWNDPKVKAWSAAQNTYARYFLDRLPGRRAIAGRIETLVNDEGPAWWHLVHAGDTWFAMERLPTKQQPFIVSMKSLDDPTTARIVVDPNVIDPKGHTAIDFFRVSADGTKLAVSMSKGGSESGDVHVFDAATGKQVDEVVPRVNGGTAGGDCAFAHDGKGLYYTRYPHEGERPKKDLDFYQQVYFHAFGTPVAKDRFELGKTFPRTAEVQLEADPHSARLIATVQLGDSGRFEHWLRREDGKWKKLTSFDDGVQQVTFGPKGRLYLLSRKDAPKGKIAWVPVDDPRLGEARTVVPQGKDAIAFDYEFGPKLVATGGAVAAVYQLGGPETVRIFDPDGKPLPAPRLLPISSAGGLARGPDGTLVFANQSYLVPTAWYAFDAKTGKTERTGLVRTSKIDFSDTIVAREMATSKDGTKVPVTILYRKGTKLDGTNPTLLTGYGAYGISQVPYFSATRHLWIEQGVVLAVAHIRGGGEEGETWHTQGMLTHKQNGFDDFAAVMRHLVDVGYTEPSRLAINGGSAGGLLMGAILTQHPKAFRAVVSHVGIYDMLRVELSPNGAFNIPEFGTVTKKDEFEALYAYSPYQHVVKGTPYPAVLFMTGANDPRVDPMQSRKMTARLQAATGSKNPILLRTSGDTGHGIGSPLSARIAQAVDAEAFILYELGVRYRPVDTTASR